VSAKFIVGAKLNSVEFQDGGVTPQEAQELCQALEKMGIDFVELSGGTQENLGMQWTKDSTRRREAFFLEFAKIITDALGPATKLKVYLTGGFRSAEGMVKGLSVVHGIGLGRPAAAEPRLCRDILEGRVYGAAKPAEAMENDIWGGIAVAAAQMAQIANGKEPLDTSNAQVMDILKADIAQWQKQTLEDGEKLEYIRSVRYSGPQQPYRTTSK
jgi:2,4-dienoyl-CoA reductase-like NADH-dependent reductase (Old Yellow Enzyme family)